MADNNLTGKVAIVTGSSRGIGRGIAERLARDGASVVVNYVGSQETAREAVGAIEQGGGTATAVQADVSDPGDVERLFSQTLDQFGRVDIVVANAGTAVAGPVAEASMEDFDRVSGVNARGTFLVFQQAAKHVSEGGRVVGISSATAEIAPEGMAIYAGSKSAVECFAEVLAKELGKRQITVNIVSPGTTETDFFANAPEGEREKALERTTLGRIGKPEDIADVVAFVVSDDAHWVTGHNIQAGGGYA